MNDQFEARLFSRFPWIPSFAEMTCSWDVFIIEFYDAILIQDGRSFLNRWIDI